MNIVYAVSQQMNSSQPTVRRIDIARLTRSEPGDSHKAGA